MEEEIWKDIPGYEGLYQASSVGGIRSVVETVGRRKRELSQCKTKWGYFQVVLTDASRKAKHESVHKLVCLTFIPIPEEMKHLLGTRFLQVNHKDQDKTNNRVENLEWCSPSYNSSYGTITQRRLNTHKLRKTVCSEADIIQMDMDGNRIRAWRSLAEIERETGMSAGYICWCCKGKYKSAYGYKWKYAEEWRMA